MHIGRDGAERFWIFLAATILQLGSIATSISILSQLHPAAWIIAQLVLCGSATYLAGYTTVELFRSALSKTSAFNSVRLGIFKGLGSLSPAGLAALICITLFLILSAIAQLLTPIHIGDEKMYHASRVLYWIWNGSVFPYTTHNDRQTTFTFGAELFFLWPVLLTKTETAGRAIFWLGYPSAAIGQYLVLRALRLGRGASLAGVLILVSTPIVSGYSVGLKPEMWFVATALGIAYWSVVLCSEPERTLRSSFFLGLYAVLCINVRPLALAVVPSVVLIPMLVRSTVARHWRITSLATGMIAGLLCSSVLVPFCFNLTYYGHALGPKGLRRVVASEVSAAQMRTHAIRSAFLLLELPDVPAPSMRSAVSDVGNRVIGKLGAGQPLPLEDRPWPGRFSYTLPETAGKFSLWGVLWLPVMAAGAFLLLRNLLRARDDLKLSPLSALMMLLAPFYCAIIFGVRWMVHSGVPERFLIAPYALAVPIGVCMASRGLGRRAFAQGFVILLAACCTYVPMRQALARAASSPVTDAQVDAPFQEALAAIPEGSRILLVGNQDAPDYPLFLPRRGYTNSVTSWGKAPFDPSRLQAILEHDRITHVVIQNDVSAFFHWAPEIATGPMAAWLARQPGITDIRLATPHMRLFAVTGGPIAAATLGVRTIPDRAPLIALHESLEGAVRLDAAFLKTPWEVEHLGPAEDGFLWMGTGVGEGVEFALWTDSDRNVQLRLLMSPGPSRADSVRTISLWLNGVPVAERLTFDGRTSITVTARLVPGRNIIQAMAMDPPTVLALPNGDTRHLIVGLHELTVESVPARSATQQQKALAAPARR